jgi:hypothetical protein
MLMMKRLGAAGAASSIVAVALSQQSSPSRSDAAAMQSSKLKRQASVLMEGDSGGMSWSAPPRDAIKKDLKTKEFDILVIGGGATGTGVAMDAATRGM